MRYSKAWKEKQDIKRKKARVLYKQGLTLREVGKMVGQSYEWVRQSVVDK